MYRLQMQMYVLPVIIVTRLDLIVLSTSAPIRSVGSFNSEEIAAFTDSESSSGGN